MAAGSFSGEKPVKVHGGGRRTILCDPSLHCDFLFWGQL